MLSLSKDEWLKEKKDLLGKAVGTSIDATMELYSDKLSRKEWIDLQILLLKGVLIILQSINEALKEKFKCVNLENRQVWQ